MEIFKVIYETLEDGDLYGISIVDTPANEKMFITLSQQAPIRLQSVDTVKKLCTGIVLMPDQKIPRVFDDGTPFLLMFDAPTIERFSQDFFDKGYQKNTTFNHDDSNWLNGTCIVESWIVEDPANDKLNALGFSSFPKGTWAITMKLSDQDWSDYIETGKAKGFSIDSFVKFEKINLNKNKNEMRKTSFLSKLVNLFAEGNVTLMDIDSSIGMLTADSLDLGVIVYDANMQPVIDTEFDFEGNHYSTDETGAIAEISTATEEIADEEVPPIDNVQLEDAPVETAVSDAPVAPDAQSLQDKIDALQAEMDKLIAEKDALTATNMELSNELVTLKAKEVTVKLGAITKSDSAINLKATSKNTETALEAISRITKNKQTNN